MCARKEVLHRLGGDVRASGGSGERILSSRGDDLDLRTSGTVSARRRHAVEADGDGLLASEFAMPSATVFRSRIREFTSGASGSRG